MSSVFVVAAKRTPFGAFGGKLQSLSATQLGAVATRAALEPLQLPLQDSDNCTTTTTAIDHVYFGNVIQSSPDAAYLARHVALQSGRSIQTPALTINRLCGSGFETVALGMDQIVLNKAQMVVCGGAESMSQAPLSVYNARNGVTLGQGLQLQDTLWAGLTDSHISTPMGQTAENLAQQYGIAREECDAYALRSQHLWAQAQANGVFAAELAPVTIQHKKKGPIVVDTDEHPRPDSTLEKLAKLPPVFAKDGVVTAANASGICDGAGVVVLASAQAVQQYQLEPLARVVSTAVTGCDPKVMGIGPVSAIRQALAQAQLTLEDMDRIEINEAFAAQFLACAKELNLDMDKTNTNGGAIALGHPLGASGSRITAHLVHELARCPDHRYHMGAACIGGGQGIAVLLERV